MEKIKVGYAVGVITPDLGLEMAGYATSSRKASGVHDDLHTRVLVIESGGEDFLIVQNEIISLDYEFSGRVMRLAEAYGIKPENTFVGAIHTHSGPKGTVQNEMGPGKASAIRGEYNKEMCEKIFKIIDGCIGEAYANKCPCTMRYGFTKAEGIGANRNEKDRPSDNTLLAMDFIREDGEKLLLYNFACHPTVLHLENTLYSADWPYGVTQSAKAAGYRMALFLNGSAGDISTRYTRKAPTFEEAERLGRLLYENIEKALENPRECAITPMKSVDFTYHMVLRNFGTVEEAQEKIHMYQKQLDKAIADGVENLRFFESKVEGAVTNLARAKSFSGESHMEIRLKLLKMGEFIFVFIPGELFSSLSTPIRTAYGEKIVFCTYFMGSHGYIADIKSYADETYEAMSSQFEPGQGEELMEIIRKEIESVR